MEKRELTDALSRIGKELQSGARLVLIGSSVGILCGQEARMTEDIDVWAPASEFDQADLEQACEKAGVSFNPGAYDAPPGPYLQIIRRGICQVGEYDESDEIVLSRFGRLVVASPPIENLIASKLIRANDDDLGDIVYLRAAFDVPREKILAALETLEGPGGAMARENAVLLDVLEGAAPGPGVS